VSAAGPGRSAFVAFATFAALAALGVVGCAGGGHRADAGGAAGGSTGACTPATRCAGDGDVQTCGARGQWASPWSCETAVCTSGNCAGSTSAGASCKVSAPGTTDCGPRAESCCTSLEVPGGVYDRTYANDGSEPTGEADPAWVSGFRLDKYLVTVGRFRQFVAASSAGWAPAPGSGKHAHLNGGLGLADSGGPGYEPGWDPTDPMLDLATTAEDWSRNLSCEPTFQTWTGAAGPNETLPMNCINWYEAYAFCIWDGGFLPSEAELEYAAAGGSELREYPWGSGDPGMSSLYSISGCSYPPGTTTCTGVMNIAPVGTATLGAGKWGQLDLAGSVSEWAIDYFAPFVDPCTDCVFLTDYSYRVARGGSFGTDAQNMFSSSAGRDGEVPPGRNSFYGARCARSP
jgi:formylglycine-generating enzyme